MAIKSKIKVLFILPSLTAGGAERVISFVSQNLDKEKFETILLIAGYSNDSAYDVSKINTIYLEKSRILTAIPSLILKILKLNPHIVVSSIAHVNKTMSIIAPFYRKTKFIGREATILSERSNEKVLRKWSLVHFLPNGFKNLDALICQSQDMANDMVTNYGVAKDKIHIINNPISNLPKLKVNKSSSEVKRYITVGRLSEVKGHLRILEILANLKHPFEYIIVGDGVLKSLIFERATLLGLNHKIKHIRFTDKVNDFLSESDMFLQGSYVEGFPNALLESCVVGTPVIAFDVPGGTKEIVVNGVNGFLVKTEKEFLERLKEDRKWDPKEIRKSVFKKFNQEKILKQYEDLFISIVSNKN